jgi:hypothetical protein
MMSDPGDGKPAQRARASAIVRALLYADFSFFVSQVRDSAGEPLAVAAHHRRWARLIADSPRLVLLAPRDHGKTTLLLVYVMWQFYRHVHDPFGRPLRNATGTFSAVLVSATWDQARVLLATFRDLLLANVTLLGEIGSSGTSEGRRQQVRWSRSDVRLRGGAELRIRAFGTSTRGLHPDLLLLDDVLSDANTAKRAHRERTYRYFTGTLLPMNPGQLIVFGTALHSDDLLHRLREWDRGGAARGTQRVTRMHRVYMAQVPGARCRRGNRALARASPGR